MDLLFLDNTDDLTDIFLSMSVCCHAHAEIWLGADAHVNDYGYDNASMVTEGDNYYVDDGNDECFTMMMMMIITIVVLLLHPSVTH